MGGIANSLYNLTSELSKNSELDLSFLCFNPYLHKKFQDLSSKITVYSPLALQYFFIDVEEAKKNLKPHHFFIYLLIKTISKIVGRNTTRKAFINYFYRGFTKFHFDIAISFSNDIPRTKTNLGCNDILENGITSKKKIAWIHNDLEELGFSRDYILSRYKGFDSVVNVSNYCKVAFEELAPEFKSKSHLIHNFISEGNIVKKAAIENPFQEKSSLTFVTVARIDNHQKRIDRILKISKKLINKGHVFNWYIIGDGPDLNNLKDESKTLNINQQLHFLGFKENPYPYIKNADCLVLSSAFEAQGMVLTESLILETPVITTDFPAAKEFVKHQVNGIISENSTKSLYSSLERIFTQGDLLVSLKKNCKQNKLKHSNQALEEFKLIL